MLCGFCRVELPATVRRDSVYCSKLCRQRAWRASRLRELHGTADRSFVLAYADPPYPGRARRYYASEEIDHGALIEELEAEATDGWALSTSADALRSVLPLCPEGARVGAWVKPIGVSSRAEGMANAWEPLIVVRGRQLPPGRRDWLRAQPARYGGDLIGRKPLAFCAWLLDCLGWLPGDTLIDKFPGSGVVGGVASALSLHASRPGSRDG